MVLLHTEARCCEHRSNTEFNNHANITSEILPSVEATAKNNHYKPGEVSTVSDIVSIEMQSQFSAMFSSFSKTF